MANKGEKGPDYAALAKQAVEQGPIPTPPSTLYFTYKRTDGDSFVGAATSAESYLRLGYTISGEETIEDFVAWNEANAAKEAPKPAPAPAHEPAHETTHGHAAG
jgi:hypothetical protein